MTHARADLAALLEEAKATVRAASDAMAKAVRESIQPAIAKLRETTPASESAAARVGELGWTIPTWGPLLGYAAYAQYETRAALDKHFLAAYRAGPTSAFPTLKASLLAAPLLAEWTPLLRQSLAAYSRRQYLVIVPALLLVLEGALLESKGRRRSRNKARHIPREWQGDKVGIVRLAWISVASFVDTLFGDHDFREPPPRFLNRHWVAHGRLAPIWRREDCLRLFQALDTINALWILK